MKVNSQLERAQLENVTSLPSAATAGRVAWDTVAGKAFLDDATNWRAFLRNDQLAIIGNSGTAANNVRFHRGANGVLQLVSGADATAEGTLSTAINQISARVENYSTGSLPAFGNLGRIAYDTTTGFPKFDNGSAWKEIVDSSTTQTISGKTLTSATLTDPLFSAAGVFTHISTPANPSGGTSKIYAKSDNKFYTLDSSGNEAQIGGGGGGVKNLITNGSADDTATTIFVPYQDSSGTRPTDGTGGTTTGITTSMTSSTPLDGTKAFLLTKDASNRQGGGWAVPFTVDPAYRAKSIKISVDYIVNSGTFVAGGSGTDSDVIWYIYDVTNSLLIEPSNIKMFSNSSTISDKFEATFQTSATGSSYRLIAHIASTSASAYELKVDNITVSPQSYVFGTPVTDASNYTPTITNTTATVDKSNWRRVGDQMVVEGHLTLTAGLSGIVNISLPAGYSIDTAKTNASSTQVLGVAYAFDQTGNLYTGHVTYNTATTVTFAGPNVTGRWTTAVPFTWVSTDTLSYKFSVPIVGWSSSVQTSDSADTRVVSANYNGSTTGTISGSLNNVTFASKVEDTHGAYSSGTYTVPVSGNYNISAGVGISGTFALNTVTKISIAVNGTAKYNKTIFSGGAVAAEYPAVNVESVPLKAGDTINIKAQCGATGPSYSSDETCFFSIARVGGPSAIAASEDVSVKYRTAAGQSIAVSPGEAVDFGTKDWDSHGAVQTPTSNFRFFAPISGEYLVNASVRWDGSFTSNNNVFLRIYKGGVAGDVINLVTVPVTGATNNLTVAGNGRVKLLAGEYIELYAVHQEAAARTLFANSISNWIEINKVGNY